MAQMSHLLNSYKLLKGYYLGDYVEEWYRGVTKGDARRLDHGSNHIVETRNYSIYLHLAPAHPQVHSVI